MSVHWEGLVVPEEYDREFFLKVLNNHAVAIGKLAKQNDQLVDCINDLSLKLGRANQVLWQIVREVYPDEAEVIESEVAEELDMAARIDAIFKEAQVDDQQEDGNA